MGSQCIPHNYQPMLKEIFGEKSDKNRDELLSDVNVQEGV